MGDDLKTVINPDSYGSEFEHGGKFYLTVGLLNLWWNPKICEKKDFGVDPPKFVQAYDDWMAAHPEVTYDAVPFVGPPCWAFPTKAKRTKFKKTFLETNLRMREIMDEQIAIKKAEEKQMWFDQGKRRDERGRPYITKNMTKFFGEDDSKAQPTNILLLPDPETGEFWL